MWRKSSWRRSTLAPLWSFWVGNPQTGEKLCQRSSCTVVKVLGPTVDFPTFSSVQSLSRVHLFVTPWTAACQASLSISNSQSLFKLMSIESLMPSNHLILCHHRLLLPSFFPRNRVFSNESVLHIRWPDYWSFSFNISPSKEYSGLISIRIDWFDLLALQGTLQSLLQQQSKSNNSLALIHIYGPTLTYIHTYYWKNHSFDQMDICQQSNVFAF